MNKNNDALGYYNILQIQPEADEATIKRQYYDMAKFWHPDHNENPQALEMFQKVSVAYNVLKDERQRLIYDLLSCVYDKNFFPSPGSLKIYKNQSAKDDVALRVLRQKSVQNGIIKESKDICNIHEAGNMVLSTSIHNWLYGWWGKNGYSATKEAIMFNLHAVTANNSDNLQLLVHNAIAYEQENNIEMAWIYAKQAEILAKNSSYLHQKLTIFSEHLNFKPKKTVKIPLWHAAELVRRQYLFPITLSLLMFFAVMLLFVGQGFIRFEHEEKGYYEERLLSGRLVATDMVENKIIKEDSDPFSKDYLIHLTEDCIIYNGPDSRYSPLIEGKAKQTLRITGYTPDRKWYQVIIDNGEKGFIEKNKTGKGEGSPVPLGSHVYKGQL